MVSVELAGAEGEGATSGVAAATVGVAAGVGDSTAVELGDWPRTAPLMHNPSTAANTIYFIFTVTNIAIAHYYQRSVLRT